MATRTLPAMPVIIRIISVSDHQLIDGKMQCIGTRSKTKYVQPTPKEPRTLESYWLKDAPIKYDEMEAEMKRVGIISDFDCKWQLLHKGGSPQKYMRALYNVCYRAKCLPFMSGPQLMEVFNTSYNAELTYYRTFNGKGRCEIQEEEIINMLSVFRSFFSEQNHKAHIKG